MTRVVALLLLAAFCLLGAPVTATATVDHADSPTAAQLAEPVPFPAAAHAAEPAAQASPLRSSGEPRTLLVMPSEVSLGEDFAVPAPEPVRPLHTRERTPSVSAELGSDVHERGPPRTDRLAVV